MQTRFRTLFQMLAAALLFATLCPRSANSQNAAEQQALRKIDDDLLSLTGQGTFRGSVLIGIDGKVAFEKGYGYADEEWNALNSTETKFRIFSLTKQYTGACILLLQERGLLSVKDPASKYISDLPDAWHSITIHQLLTHTSGIPNYPDVSPRSTELERLGASPWQMLELVATKPLDFTPGTQLRYSNTGYILLGMIIEKVSEQTYAEFLKKNIFDHLGMENSGYDDQSVILKNRASGYTLRDGRVVNAPFGDMSYPFSAGGIYSTVEDMYRWNEALAEPGKVLTAHSLEQMFAVYPETAAHDANYGYGVVIAHRFGRLLYYHAGGWYGFESVIQRYPKERLCIVVLENLDPTKPWDVADHIASTLLGEPLRTKGP